MTDWTPDDRRCAARFVLDMLEEASGLLEISEGHARVTGSAELLAAIEAAQRILAGASKLTKRMRPL